MMYDEKLENVLISGIAPLSNAFQHTGLVILQLEESNNGVTSKQLQVGSLYRPWGLGPPPCGNCDLAVHITLKAMKNQTVKARCGKCKLHAQLSAEGLKGDRLGRDGRLWMYPWPYENRVWNNVEWKAGVADKGKGKGKGKEMELEGEEGMDMDWE